MDATERDRGCAAGIGGTRRRNHISTATAGGVNADLSRTADDGRARRDTSALTRHGVARYGLDTPGTALAIGLGAPGARTVLVHARKRCAPATGTVGRRRQRAGGGRGTLAAENAAVKAVVLVLHGIGRLTVRRRLRASDLSATRHGAAVVATVEAGAASRRRTTAGLRIDIQRMTIAALVTGRLRSDLAARRRNVLV